MRTRREISSNFPAGSPQEGLIHRLEGKPVDRSTFRLLHRRYRAGVEAVLRLASGEEHELEPILALLRRECELQASDDDEFLAFAFPH